MRFSKTVCFVCFLITLNVVSNSLLAEEQLAVLATREFNLLTNGLNNTDIQSCKRFQFQFDLFGGDPSGDFQSMRVLIERDDEHSAMLATSPNGFPLLYINDEVGYSLSLSERAYRTFPCPGYIIKVAGAPLDAKTLSVGMTLQSDAKFEKPTCALELGSTLETLQHFKCTEEETRNAAIIRFAFRHGITFSLIKYREPEKHGNGSLFFRVEGGMTGHVYNISRDVKPSFSLLEKKQLRLFMAISKASNHVPVVSADKWSIEDRRAVFIPQLGSRENEMLSEGFHRQLVLSNAHNDNAAMKKWLAFRRAIEATFHDLQVTKDDASTITTELSQLLDELRSEDTSLHFDPSMRATLRQFRYGPLFVKQLLDKSMHIAKNKDFDIATRRIAFECVCHTGWPAFFDQVMHAQATELGLTSPSSDFVYASGIDWKLVKMR